MPPHLACIKHPARRLALPELSSHNQVRVQTPSGPMLATVPAVLKPGDQFEVLLGAAAPQAALGPT